MSGVDKKTFEAEVGKQITQEKCDVAKFLFRNGNSMKVIAQTLRVNPSTVSKIKTAGFDLKTYLENRKASNRLTAENKKKTAEEQPEVIDYTTAPIEGQMEMDLTPEPEKKPEMSDSTKMMRFLAGQVGEIVKALNAITEELKKLNGGDGDEK